MENTEIEIQVRVERVAALLDKLDKDGKLVFEGTQRDEYFTPAHRDFLKSKPTDEWLRIRESDKSSVTFKNWHHDPEGKSDFCDEYETIIENPEQLKRIFLALNMELRILVEKYRRSWLVDKYEVSIDQVTGLGNFVEVEYKGTEDVDPKEVVRQMVDFLKTSGVGKIERNYVGYPYLLAYGTDGKFEEVV